MANQRMKLTGAAILVSRGMKVFAAGPGSLSSSFGGGGLAVGGRLWRDASNRLTCEWSGVEAADYPASCRAIADAFGLAPAAELVVGLDAMFWDFGRDSHVVGLEWDIWMGFMAVAKSPASEPLIHQIAAWLESHQEAEPGAAADPAS